MPARVSGVVPSPQSTLIEVTVPSGSDAEKVAVIRVPVVAVVGVTEVTLTTGGLSVIVTEPVAEPVEPLLSVADTVTVKV